MNFKRWFENYEDTDFEEQSKKLEVKFTPAILASMSKKLKSMGYGVRGSADIKQLLARGIVYKDGTFYQPDWQIAYDAAVRTEQKTKATRQLKKDLTPNVQWSVVNSLGTTLNPRTAGYIKPSGKLMDLSGGSPTIRGEDHRIVGGYAAIQELGAHLGYIRYFPEGPGFELRKMPTTEQIIQMQKLIAYHNKEISLDLYDGIGEWNERNEAYDSPARTWSHVYPKDTKPMRIINAIKQFYGGQTPTMSIGY